MTFKSESSATPSVVLNDGNVIPKLGFGVFQVPPDEAVAAVTKALEVGYRSIDTAAIYGNEAEVGRAIADFGLPRDEVYITTKLWNSEQGYDSTLRAFDESMAKLGLDYLDLYLIHWPVPRADRYVDTFRAFQALKSQGRIGSIGVSNFTVDHLERLIGETGEVPVVNQIELHPTFTQAELRAYHAEKGIATEAWSPLGQGAELKDPTIVEIAQQTGRTPAQVIIRWHLQLGNVVIPKSVTPSRIAENFDVFSFELTSEQIERISALDSGNRIGGDPETLTLGVDDLD
ncbi:aldo/keto reductase [Nocardia sp. CDC159]|uniref:Aldo/keto reductase n=1 Tax=Nocardia pulmonis TaxID=2951408 RepID=A0A9X2IW15_9NOCA|nr:MULTISPECIES: aldo/keto reductase [Nocardia]MCM6773064.1 aldo/keto reductase [Nocardia pulmonis]MCM6785633.1 aldo/keto reductase [Nocardia sp. CDC159]